MTANAQDGFESARGRLLADIAQLTRETRLETGRAALSEQTMAAMRTVPRHRFVVPGDERYAYDNRPLPIGHGQTISQPFIVALMTDFLELKPTDKVLEIGTGCGYQAAVLSELAREVYSIEIVEPLGREAAQRLITLGYRNITTKIGDGYQGWAEHAPFDAIIVTAAARDVPQPLVDQLKPGGRLVIPVGSQGGAQTLYVMEKQPDGKVVQRAVLAVRFVPLTDGRGRQQ
ncbi:MAG: protein-L-isoaspartate(D-aspartate) O-methyltransferase [Burkholderiales bacterium]|nr:protein-L-isoaspartate(D-aspartate) O-methyltransferase [Burkholderiales bacterium]